MKSFANLFQRIRALTGSTGWSQPKPFTSVRTTQRWLDNLPNLSEYELHHALVEGLERFNGDVRGDALKRIKMLQIMEETGLSMQAGIVVEYINTPESNQHGRQVLWREAHLFWSQMATAYLQFLKLVLRGEEKDRLKPWSTEIILKNLRYAALSIRWEHFRGQRPAELAWRRLHRVYRMAEIAGVALSEFELEGRMTSCAREYVLALLFDLANPHVFQPREVQNIVDILEGLGTLPVPEIGLRRDRHSHMIDLSTSLGAEAIEDRWVPGKRLRYLELRGTVSELESRVLNAPDAQTGLMCKQIARIVGRVGARRDSVRKPVAGEVGVAAGMQAVVEAMQAGADGDTRLERWKLRDESREGLGFVLPQGREMPVGRLLVVSRLSGEKHWQLLAVRWVREEGGESLLGAESLSKHPKLVEVSWQSGQTETNTLPAIFLPLTNTSHGAASNLLIPQASYEKGRTVVLRDEEVLYRLSLGEVVESHEAWVRVGFDVLAREKATEQ